MLEVMTVNLNPAAITLLLLAALLLTAIPLAGWLTMEKTDNPSAAKLWFGGLALNALALVIIVAPAQVAKPITNALAQAMVAATIMMMVASVRSLNELTKLPRWIFLGVPLASFIVMTVFGYVDGRDAVGRSAFLLFTSIADVWLVFEVWRLYRTSRCSSVILIGIILAAITIVNAIRSLAFFFFDASPYLLSFSISGIFGWLANLGGVVLCSFGYWGYALERAHSRELAAKQSQAAAEARAEEAVNHSIKLKEIIHQRDEMIMLNSRLTVFNTMSVFAATMTHEMSQYLQALTVRLGAAKISAEKTDDPLALEITDALMLTESIASSVRPLRDLLVANTPTLSPVVVAEETRKILQIVIDEGARKGVQVSLNISEGAAQDSCLCDRALLHRVIINFINNSIEELLRQRQEVKISSDAVVVTLERSSILDKPAITLAVSDNGRGFPEHMVGLQVDLLRSQKDQGIGIGLALAQTVVNSWGGEMTISNDNGALVTLTIPTISRKEKEPPIEIPPP